MWEPKTIAGCIRILPHLEGAARRLCSLRQEWENRFCGSERKESDDAGRVLHCWVQLCESSVALLAGQSAAALVLAAQPGGAGATVKVPGVVSAEAAVADHDRDEGGPLLQYYPDGDEEHEDGMDAASYDESKEFVEYESKEEEVASRHAALAVPMAQEEAAPAAAAPVADSGEGEEAVAVRDLCRSDLFRRGVRAAVASLWESGPDVGGEGDGAPPSYSISIPQIDSFFAGMLSDAGPGGALVKWLVKSKSGGINASRTGAAMHRAAAAVTAVVLYHTGAACTGVVSWSCPHACGTGTLLDAIGDGERAQSGVSGASPPPYLESAWDVGIKLKVWAHGVHRARYVIPSLFGCVSCSRCVHQWLGV